MRALKRYVVALTEAGARACADAGQVSPAFPQLLVREHIYEVTTTARRYRPRAKKKGRE